MWITVHETIDEYHVRIQLANFVGHVELVDAFGVNVFQIVHLTARQILHDQHTLRG